MQTRSFPSWLIGTLLLAVAAGGQSQGPANALPLASGGVLRYFSRPNGTLVRISGLQVLLPRDQTVAAGSPVADFKVLGEKASRVYVVTDSYASKPGGMSYCQAGQEQFVRVLARGGSLVQTFSQKVASCISNLELGSPGMAWDAGSSMLKINWLKGPSRYKVDDQGAVTAVGSGK
jgi:hypothetical protein